MGINRSYVSGLELGPRNPTILTLWHAAKAIGVTVRAFFDDEKLSLRRQRFLYGMAGSERSDHRRSFVLLLALWLRRIFALVPGGFGSRCCIQASYSGVPGRGGALLGRPPAQCGIKSTMVWVTSAQDARTVAAIPRIATRVMRVLYELLRSARS
jgi:Helix-turn-helix